MGAPWDLLLGEGHQDAEVDACLGVKLGLGCCSLLQVLSVCNRIWKSPKEEFWGEEESIHTSTLEMHWGEGIRTGVLPCASQGA